MKKILHKLINSAGYQLIRYRPAAGDEFPEQASFWEDFFSLAPSAITDIYKNNREVLKKIDDWMPEEVYNQSLFRYGIPRSFLGTVKKSSINDLPVEFTYTDLIAYLGSTLQSVKYLEIGVSAGKNFYQIMHSLHNSFLYGIDIEEINPVIEQRLSKKEEAWASEETYEFRKYGGEIAHIHYTLNRYDFLPSNNEIYYLKGDKFKPDLWRQLNANTFNLVFSDAFHKPESIRSEFQFLTELDLLDPDNLIMVWDDLDDADMQIEFKKICLELKKRYGTQSHFALYDLHGSYGGSDDGIHKIGVFRSESNHVLK